MKQQKGIKNKKIYKITRGFYYKLKGYFLGTLSFFLRFFLITKNKYQRSNITIPSYGYIYTAFGDAFYDECINSVRILKKFTNLPIHLFTDKKNIHENERKLFFSIKIVPNLHVRSKVDYIHMSPFENTIYLDTDIVIARNIDDLFQLLNRFPIVATLDTARKRYIMSKKIPEYGRIPYAFGEVNTIESKPSSSVGCS